MGSPARYELPALGARSPPGAGTASTVGFSSSGWVARVPLADGMGCCTCPSGWPCGHCWSGDSSVVPESGSRAGDVELSEALALPDDESSGARKGSRPATASGCRVTWLLRRQKWRDRGRRPLHCQGWLWWGLACLGLRVCARLGCHPCNRFQVSDLAVNPLREQVEGNGVTLHAYADNPRRGPPLGLFLSWVSTRHLDCIDKTTEVMPRTQVPPRVGVAVV